MFPCYYILVNPVKLIIIDINLNNWTTYTGMGKLMESIYVCVYNGQYCGTKIRLYLRATRCSGGVYWHPYS